ncbi:MAG: tetratricopeptide repeat protein [Verrucomicrobiota bacterium]
MTTEERWRRDIRKWRPRAAQGDGTALSNIAVAYRVLGRTRLSAQWFRKAAMAGDGDAMVDYAYCLQHGAGVRRDLVSAEAMYRRAIVSNHICDNGREEALYLLSVVLLRAGSDSSRREALKLLKAATVDGDYPVAQRLLEDVAHGREGIACTCRRYLRPGLARVHCLVHRPRR